IDIDTRRGLMVYVAVGKPIGAVEGAEKVTGGMEFTADLTLPGTLWIKVLRSPHPHARIRSIDTSKAAALPGVAVAVTGKDFPDARVGIRMRDMPVLAVDKVRFSGEPVAAVAAETTDIAEAAIALIDVEYEELPAVYDALEALAPGAPVLHDDPASYAGAPERSVDDPNVQSYTEWEHGDLEEAFGKADRVFEHTFRTPLTPHGYLESNASTVWVHPEGNVEVWASNKGPYNLRETLIKQLGAPEGRVNVHVMPVGGDFGAKSSIIDAPLCYLISQRTHRPVKFVHTYTEELIAGPRRHPAVITVRTGVTNDGTLCAMSVRAAFAGGAYAAFKANPQVTVLGVRQAGSCYRIPAVKVEEYCVYSNQVSGTQTRTPGGPQIVFAVESHLDLIARELGMDQVAFRMKNLIDDGEPTPMGQVWNSVKAKETLRAALDAVGWDQPKPPHVGRGIAIYERPAGAGKSSAAIAVASDEGPTLQVSVANCGQGAYTVLQQIVAEKLGLPAHEVSVQSTDTDTLPYESGVGGSKTTNSAGNAAASAADDLLDALAVAAAAEWGCAPHEVEHRDGAFIGPLEQILTFREVASLASKGGPLVCTATYEPPEDRTVTAYCAQVAEVEVDPETGYTKVVRVVTAHDVGLVLNPLSHQGQINGGVVQGMGFATCEETPVVNGHISTLNMGDYKLPGFGDIPKLETILLEEEAGPVPFNGKAIGELPNVPIAAAIANAVHDASGIRITDLPITAEKVHAALLRETR
ncbi:MAG: xanthine dehydrogenase family protein molybdopterin-binding subunit, partial [Dehalococcoidia bacterium]